MAGEWIKIEKSTPDKPEVLRLAIVLGISPGEAFTLCFRFWSWADSNFADGTIKGIPISSLDSALGFKPGFAQALRDVGWLKDRNDALLVPNFNRHLGQSAKRRALTASRTKAYRDRGDVTQEKRKRDAASVTRSISLSPSSSGLRIPPTLEEVAEYCRARASPVDPQEFLAFYEANGWVQGKGKKIKNWHAAVQTWERREKRKPEEGPKPLSDERKAELNRRGYLEP